LQQENDKHNKECEYQWSNERFNQKFINLFHPPLAFEVQNYCIFIRKKSDLLQGAGYMVHG
jgi:hypothetical protein